MEDQLRDIVLRQVVDIILELASQRFDMIGVLLKRDGIGKNAWYIDPMAGESIDDSITHRAITHTNSIEYWTDFVNSNLQDINDNNFGITGKKFFYSRAWFMRSLVPSLYDTSLDTIGFPLLHGDFHSQNIMVTEDIESNPRVTAVIDWEFTATVSTFTFAQYPLFIVDHPVWDDNHPLRPRNIRDQASFDKIMHEAELERNPEGNGQQPISHPFSNCRAVYLFEQAFSNPILHAKLFDQLFELIYGDDEDFSVYYYRALMR